MLSRILSIAMLVVAIGGSGAAVDPRPASALSTTSAPSSAPGTASTPATCTSASRADFDGDGSDDLVTGDPFADVSGQAGAGAVHILLNGGTGGVVTLRAPDAAAGDGFGWSVRTAHVNDDSCLDVIVGAPYADVDGRPNAGAGYVFYGTPSSQARAHRFTADQPERDAHFGWSLATADLPGGGTLVAVGAPHTDGGNARDSGAVHLFRVRDTAEPLRTITQDDEGVIGNSEIGDAFGWSVALGRLGGSSADLDLAVGSPYENNDGTGKQLQAGKPNVGAVTVVFDVSAAGKPTTSAKWDLPLVTTSVPERADDRLGYALDYAEWNGDGYLAATAPLADAGSTDAGLVVLFVRKGEAAVTPLRTVRAGSAWSVTFWDDAGVLSVAVGCPYQTVAEAEAGVVNSFAVDRPAGSPRPAVEGDRAYGHLGASVTDVGGDSAVPGPGLLVGAPDRGNGGAVMIVNRDSNAYRDPGMSGSSTSADIGAAVAG